MKSKLDKMFESDFIRVPRSFIRKFNLNTAVMLSEIYSEYKYWEERNSLQTGGWFFSTIENMYYHTGLSKHQQSVACKELEEYGIIKVKYHGMPKKRYFKFDMVAVKKLYNDFELNVHTDEEQKGSRRFEGFSF